MYSPHSTTHTHTHTHTHTVPSPSTTLSQRDTVFLGDMFTLTCTAQLDSSVDVGVSVSVSWSGPGQFTSTGTSATLLAGTNSHQSQLTVSGASESGNYSCTVTLDSASEFISQSDPVSRGVSVRVGELCFQPPDIHVTVRCSSWCPLCSRGDL